MRRWLLSVLLGATAALAYVLSVPTPTLAQSTQVQIQIAINQLTTGITPFTFGRIATSGYLNWGNVTGDAGYGLRDNAGNIQLKQLGDPGWTTISASGTGDLDASYLTRVPEALLTDETALSAFATGILINTTGTGLPTIYAGDSCAAQFPRSVDASGAFTCASVSLIADVTGTLPLANGGINRAVRANRASTPAT